MAGIARLVRRICLLREQGDAGRAARLQETDLAAAVRDLQAAHGPDVLREEGLLALFEAERRRVAEAVLLAELLIPHLTGQRLAPRPAASVPAQPAPARDPDAGPPAIPDLLDAMLAAERAGRRPSSAFTREH